ICIRLRADYLAIATIGIAEIIKLILKNEGEITNGPQGIQAIPRGWEHLSETQVHTSAPWSWVMAEGGWKELFASLPNWWFQPVFMLTVLGAVACVYVLLERARLSPWGRVMTAIRENEAAARAAGKNVTRLRLEAFVVGGVIIGLAGALFAQQIRFLEPTNAFDPTKLTFLVWVMLIAGGSGNNRGAILGGMLVWTLWSASEIFIRLGSEGVASMFPQISVAELVTKASFLRMFLIGLMLQVILQRFPGGILPEQRPARAKT
ncbi:MAG: branched-chain amino acid ABC transporter permease, partial [Pseudomonadota bacterium]